MTGLEPATSGVTGRRSNQLSYIRRSRGPVGPVRRGRWDMRRPQGCQVGRQVRRSRAQKGTARAFRRTAALG